MKQCPVCGNKEMVKSVITEKIKYRDVERLIENFVVFECSDCEESFYDQQSEFIWNQHYHDLQIKAEQNAFTKLEHHRGRGK